MAKQKSAKQKSKKLTPKRQAFVEAYTGEAQGNATEAARRAGYSRPKQQGSRLLTFVDVQQAIDAATAQVREAAILTRQERQELLTKIAKADEEIREYHVTKDGVVVETAPLVKERERAIELLGKMQGDFIERLDIKLMDALEDRLDELERKLDPEVYKQVLEVLEGDDDGE
ncbi:MAG: terminase small subunit [Polyangiales bacterium]